jgi:hypothetical protein
MEWLKILKFPDGYAAGFRRAVNLKTNKITDGKTPPYNVSWVLQSKYLEGVR